jgi:hypothetical protein
MTVRKTQTVTANDEEFLVKELTVAEILGFLDQETPEEGEPGPVDEVAGLMAQIDDVLEITIPGLKAEVLKTWAPSEIEKVYDTFRAVNQTFFAIAQRLGLDNLLKEVEQAIARDFSNLFVRSLSTGTPTP